MTLKELRQYRSICVEILEIDMQIKNVVAHSTVQGSDKYFPYLLHTKEISGIPETKDNTALLSEASKLRKRKCNIESFISGIDDSLTRRIFELRFFKGLSWRKIAFQVGGYATEDSVKKICYRYVKK